MTSATHTVNGTTVVQETEKYDIFGNRVEVDVTPGSTTTTETFAYDNSAPSSSTGEGEGGGEVWADLDVNRAVTMRRLYVDGQVAARIDNSNSRRMH